MAENRTARAFDTDQRIRLGIWGLGRGMHFYRTCDLLNIDVVAGCDYNEHMRQNFLQANPGAFATADAEEFLDQDFDAVLLATFCPAHADDAIQCLKAGKHVVSEVTAFHTLAEGVRLVEAVEKSDRVYNLAENCPFSAANMWLARKWAEGLFGDLMYAEYEYVHECRDLAYTYSDGLPVQPGEHIHSWRSWLHYHYYCTHSLGPVMLISGTRPTRVVSLMGKQMLAGDPMSDSRSMGGVAPSLINMSNGAVVRNLMGTTTNDTHVQRLWGTLGAAMLNVGAPLQVRLGAAGKGELMQVNPSWDHLGTLAAKTGHGGGDFWILYYFARQILYGTPAPFDIYSAADVTIPGIQALRSAMQDGMPQDVPDFRDPLQRARYRDDDWQQDRLDHTRWAFGKVRSSTLTKAFSTTIPKLIQHAVAYRAYADCLKIVDDVTEPARILDMLDTLLERLPELLETYAMARRIIKAHPRSNAARALRELLEEVGDEATVTAPGFAAGLKRQRAALRRRFPHLPEEQPPACC